jgi:hypothetical protein
LRRAAAKAMLLAVYREQQPAVAHAQKNHRSLEKRSKTNGGRERDTGPVNPNSSRPICGSSSTQTVLLPLDRTLVCKCARPCRQTGRASLCCRHNGSEPRLVHATVFALQPSLCRLRRSLFTFHCGAALDGLAARIRLAGRRYATTHPWATGKAARPPAGAAAPVVAGAQGPTIARRRAQAGASIDPVGESRGKTTKKVLRRGRDRCCRPPIECKREETVTFFCSLGRLVAPGVEHGPARSGQPEAHRRASEC